MASFRKKLVATSLEESIAAAEHLDSRHAAVVAAARQLAIRVDQLNRVGWVIDGKLDNVTLPTFLRYCDSLGLTVDKEPAKRGPKPKADEPKPEPAADPRASRALRMLSSAGGKVG